MIALALLWACGGGEKSRPDPAPPDPNARVANAAPEPEAAEPVEEEPEDAPEPEMPSLAPDLVSGIAECDRVIALYMSCDKMPAQVRDAMAQAARDWRDAVAKGGDDVRQQLAQACTQMNQSVQQALDSLGCGSSSSSGQTP